MKVLVPPTVTNEEDWPNEFACGSCNGSKSDKS